MWFQVCGSYGTAWVSSSSPFHLNIKIVSVDYVATSMAEVTMTFMAVEDASIEKVRALATPGESVDWKLAQCCPRICLPPMSPNALSLGKSASSPIGTAMPWPPTSSSNVPRKWTSSTSIMRANWTCANVPVTRAIVRCSRPMLGNASDRGSWSTIGASPPGVRMWLRSLGRTIKPSSCTAATTEQASIPTITKSFILRLHLLHKWKVKPKIPCPRSLWLVKEWANQFHWQTPAEMRFHQPQATTLQVRELSWSS